jgi:ribosomal protein L30E
MSAEKAIEMALKDGKTVTGRNAAVRALKLGSLQSVFYSSNCPPDFVRELDYYGKLSKAEVLKFDGDSAKLGQACGKPFKIVILGIEK